MAGITLEIANKHLALWLAAEEKVSRGQAYKIGDRSLTRADLAEIRSSIKYWNDLVTSLGSSSGGGCRVMRAVPVDD